MKSSRTIGWPRIIGVLFVTLTGLVPRSMAVDEEANALREAFRAEAAAAVVPKTDAAEGFASGDARIRPIFFAGPPYQGRPTRVFAWVGRPGGREQVPGIVLIHGGGGTAFASWVKLWVDRGYAAIAFDTSGSLPVPENAKPRPRNPEGGPDGGSRTFSQLGNPLADQWPFHALSAAIRAHSLLRAEPGVDPARTGVTGISWGGYLTCLLAGTDPRLRFAIPVYGCGFYQDTTFASALDKVAPEHKETWFRFWDASRYLSQAACPVLWVNGTNDHFFWLPAWQQSYREIPPDRRTLCLRVNMPHGHPPAGDPPEVAVFADSQVRGGDPLPAFRETQRKGAVFEAVVHSVRPVRQAELIWTDDSTSPWEQRVWHRQPAAVDGQRARADIPATAFVCFLNVEDDRGCLATAEVKPLP